MWRSKKEYKSRASSSSERVSTDDLEEASLIVDEWDSWLLFRQLHWTSCIQEKTCSQDNKQHNVQLVGHRQDVQM